MKETICGREAALMLDMFQTSGERGLLEDGRAVYGAETIEEARALLKIVLEMAQTLEAIISEASASSSSTIRISKNYTVISDGIELHLRPLSKTLFIFFLRHPEGVEFKALSGHRQELLELYMGICPMLDMEQASSTIDRLLDPSSNSIDTQRYLLNRQLPPGCSLSGGKGMKKRVLLGRTRVIFDD